MSIYRSLPISAKLLACVLTTLIYFGSQPQAQAVGTFISAPSRVDMVHDAARDTLYITSGGEVLRYKLSTATFLTPFTLGGTLKSIDLSPDGNTLAVADTTQTATKNGIYLIDLTTGNHTRVEFTKDFMEGGTWAVAFGGDGSILVTSMFNGSGGVPLRRYVPGTGTTTTLTWINQDAMVTASGDGSVIAFAETNNSGGPFGRYRVSDGNLLQAGFSTGTSWFNYEVGVSRNGSQLAIPTYGGTFIYNSSFVKIATLGTHAGPAPIGVVYSPTQDRVYFPWATTTEVRAYDPTSFLQKAAYDFEDEFDHPGNDAFVQGRMKISRDGDLLFASVNGGIRYIRISEQPVNPQPTADSQSASTYTATAKAITLTGGGGNGPLTYSLVSTPQHGTLSGTIPNLTYTPTGDYSGADSFTFKTTAGGVDSELATVSISVLPGATIVVTTTLDTVNAGDGLTSLREAIIEANSSSYPDVISFNIPTGDTGFDGSVYTIKPTTTLPTIASNRTTIDGSTQTQFSGDTNPAGPEIVLNGSLGNSTIDGLLITAANCVIRGLVINDIGGSQQNPHYALRISGVAAANNRVEGCYIGTNSTGTRRQMNDHGIYIVDAPNNTIGGTTAASRNVLSGNNLYAVWIHSTTASYSASNNIIQGNYFGTNAAGTAIIAPPVGQTLPYGNNVDIFIRDSPNTQIGGTTAGARNIISAGANEGVWIYGAGTTGTKVQGNYLGTDVTGTVAIPNGSGILMVIDSSGSLIGGTDAGAGNLISGNSGIGVWMAGNSAGNYVQGNLIGTDAAGLNALPNRVGIQIQSGSRNNFIGNITHSSARNRIAYNTEDGVRIEDAFGGTNTGNSIRGNRIYSNGGLGINLRPSGEALGTVTPNDTNDADSGANTLLNYPVIDTVTVSIGSTTVTGTYHGTPNKSIGLEFYSVSAADPNGFGEGENFLGGKLLGTDASGNVTFTFTTNAILPTQLITATAITHNAGGTNDTSEFSRAVAPTTPPTISDIASRSVNQGSNTGPIAFTVGDVETAAANLVVTGSSSNTTLIPNANIVFGGSGANRTVTVTPAAGQTGGATITITVTDESGRTAQDTFGIGINLPPTISDISDRSIVPSSNTGAIAFTVGDAVTPVASLALSGSSSNTTLVPNANIVFGGSGANRTVTVTPVAGQSGSTIITITVTDGNGATAQDTFVLTVAANTPPTISDTLGWRISPGSSTGIFDVIVGDAETPAANLTLTATSSNTTLLPVSGIVFGGSGANRTATVTPAPGQTGTSFVTFTVTDGNGATAHDSFNVWVVPFDSDPTISDITDKTTSENEMIGVAFTVADTDTPLANLTVTATSSNQALVPNAGIVVGGSGANRNVDLYPTPGQSGTTTITVTVRDDIVGTGTESFVLTVTPNPPTISNIPDQSTPLNTAAGPIDFTVGGVILEAFNATLSATSSNQTLVPNANIVLSNYEDGPAERTITITPAAEQSGTTTITITLNDGFGRTVTDTFVLTVTGAPTISSFSPSTGAVGSQVTVSGNNLGNTTQVKLDNVVASFTQLSNNQVRFVVPNGASTGKISVTTPSGTATSATDYTVVAALPPQISNFSPSIAGWGTTVTVSGNNLSNTSAVSVNGFVTTAITQVSANQIRFLVPAGSTTGKISLTTPGGASTSATDLTVIPPPQIGNFSPTAGTIGTIVTISGSHLSTTTSVRFNGFTTTNFTVVSNNQVRAVVPNGASTGQISVTTLGGTATSVGTFNFTVILPPSANSFSPTSGIPGTVVTISGNNLSTVTAVRFNGVPSLNITKISPHQVRAVVPEGATTGKISITAQGGTVSTVNNFTVLAMPVITAFSPTSGPVGTAVTLSGSGFATVTGVRFNGRAAAFAIDSDSQITTTVPNGATTGKITVSNSLGTVQSSDSFTVTSGVAPPGISSFSPTSGAAGVTVVINGTGFSGATNVSFSGAAAPVSAPFRVDSSMKITATVPASAATGPISVTTPGGTVTSSANFSILRHPVIFSFSPGSGPAGTSVLISGANFTGVTAVRFTIATGTASTPFTMTSPTQIRCNVPLSAITGKISVSNGFGTGQSSTDFKVLPRIDSFTPVNGPEGTVVTITGRAFTGAIDVQFDGVSVGAGNFTVVNATTITTTVPAGATTGLITIVTPSGSGTSTSTFVVNDD